MYNVIIAGLVTPKSGPRIDDAYRMGWFVKLRENICGYRKLVSAATLNAVNKLE